MSKICENCGKTVDEDANFCPYCHGQTFTVENEITLSEDRLVHKLFYWNYNGNYVLSKTKLCTICIFIIFLIMGTTVRIFFFASFVFALITLMLGIGIHRLLPKPNNNKIKHNDYGFTEDLIHLLFYWQNREGEFVLSKSKIITIIVTIICSLVGLTMNTGTVITMFIGGFTFGIPTFVMCYIIHKLINPNPKLKKKENKTIKKQKTKKIHKKESKIENNTNIIPEYVKYKNQIEELKNRFDLKESQTYELIEKRFEPPQMTYTRFCSVVDKTSKLFNQQVSSSLKIIELSTEYSPKVEKKLKSEINMLSKITNKLDELKNELVFTMDESKPEDMNNLFDEMHDLIDSIKDY